MSRRKEKRERAAYHDSRRYLKKHPPRLSDPLFGLTEKVAWAREVEIVIQRYPEWKRDRERAMSYGAYRTGRRGWSAENVVLRHSGGSVEAVETALKQFPREDRNRLQAVLRGGEDLAQRDKLLLGKFRSYLAVFLGYGRPRYNLKKR